jgi:hypothetical protein
MVTFKEQINSPYILFGPVERLPSLAALVDLGQALRLCLAPFLVQPLDGCQPGKSVGGRSLERLFLMVTFAATLFASDDFQGVDSFCIL